MEQYLTVNETARILRVHADTVRRWLRSGKLVGVKHGKDYRISASSVHRSELPALAVEETPIEKALRLRGELRPRLKPEFAGKRAAAEYIDANRKERERELNPHN